MGPTMNNSWIFLYRKIIKTSFYKNSKAVHLAIHCIIRANYKDRSILWNNELVALKAGQFITGRKVLSDETGISEQGIRTILKVLEKCQFLTTTSTNKYSVITICNYKEYQNQDNEINQESNQQVTSNQPASNHRQEIQEVNKELIKDIIDYLNLKTGKNYKPNTKKTITTIQSRIKEGFTKDDFIKVIDIKSKAWVNNPKMNEYLRPETLFGNKFEGYLNSGLSQLTVEPTHNYEEL